VGKINYLELLAKAERQSANRSSPLPAGEYDAAVTGAKFAISKAGNPYYQVELTVVSGEHKGRKAWKALTLTPASARLFFDQMAVLGLDEEFFDRVSSEPDAEERVCAELVGATCRFIAKDSATDYTEVRTLKAAA